MNKFSDMPGLVYYLNAGEPNTVTKTVNAVTSILSSHEKNGSTVEHTFTDLLAGGNLQHGVSTIGAGNLATFTPTGNCPFTTVTPVGDVAGPLCRVVVCQLTDDTATGRFWNNKNSNFAQNWSRHGVDSGRVMSTVAGSTMNASTGAEKLVAGTPTVLMWMWDQPDTVGEFGGYKLIKDGVVLRDDTRVRPELVTAGDICFFDDWAGSQPFPGHISIIADYQHYPTDTQIAELTALCNVWLSTGSAPPGETLPTSCVFQASTFDTQATLSWVWSADPESDPATWVNVSTVPGLSTSLSPYNEQVNGQLNVESATTVDAAGWVRCLGVADYATEYSSPAELDIRPAT